MRTRRNHAAWTLRRNMTVRLLERGAFSHNVTAITLQRPVLGGSRTADSEGMRTCARHPRVTHLGFSFSLRVVTVCPKFESALLSDQRLMISTPTSARMAANAASTSGLSVGMAAATYVNPFGSGAELEKAHDCTTTSTAPSAWASVVAVVVVA